MQKERAALQRGEQPTQEVEDEVKPKPKTFRSGVGKYINPQAAKRPAAKDLIFEPEVPDVPKKKIPAKTTLGDFSSWWSAYIVGVFFVYKSLIPLYSVQIIIKFCCTNETQIKIVKKKQIIYPRFPKRFPRPPKMPPPPPFRRKSATSSWNRFSWSFSKAAHFLSLKISGICKWVL